jgi:hypothetical protein
MPCVALVLATWSRNVRADEPAWLTWQAPPECPTEDHIAATLEGWLGRPFGAEEAQVTASVTANAAGWNVNVLVAQRELRGERTMRTRTCIEAADFVALSVALAVDPALEGSLPAAAASNEEEQPSAPTFEERSNENVNGTSRSAPAPAPTEPAAATTTNARRAPKASQRDQATPLNVTWHVQAGASLDTSTFPSARLGGAAEVGVDIERVSVSGGATWLPPVTEPVPNAQSDVAFSRLTGRLRIGHVSTLGPWQVSPFVEGQLGQLVAEAVEANYWSSELWASVGAGAQASWPARSRLQLVGALEALFPLTRSTFKLSGGTEVHEVPAVTLGADLGLRVNF